MGVKEELRVGTEEGVDAKAGEGEKGGVRVVVGVTLALSREVRVAVEEGGAENV